VTPSGEPVAESRYLMLAGCGSVGRRHLRNLRRLGWRRIVLLRTGHGTLPDDELADYPVERDLARALAYEPVAAVVANPTALHLDVALPAADAGCHLLIEKPVSHSLEGLDLLQGAVQGKGVQIVVGFQFRFHPGLRQVAALVREDAVGPVSSVQVHWGEYLPGWHPWEDHRRSYSARADLGGGVLLTLCHPFDYLRWLFGEATELAAFTATRGGLGISVEDTADVLIRFASGVQAHVHLDYVQRPPAHWLQIVGQSGTIRWDAGDGVVRCDRADGEAGEFAPPPDFERNALFLDEMRHFVACVEGRERPLCTLDDGALALRWALAAKQAATEKRVVRLG
jgi:predicted dehydrogenase